MTNAMCADNRFEVIAKAKEKIVSSTNIKDSLKEMKVLDDILFRMWQCDFFDNGWHTGTPTEEGEYVVFCQYRKDDGKLRKYKTVFEFKNGEWTNLPALEGNLDEYELIAWYGQKIEPYEG